METVAFLYLVTREILKSFLRAPPSSTLTTVFRINLTVSIIVLYVYQTPALKKKKSFTGTISSAAKLIKRGPKRIEAVGKLSIYVKDHTVKKLETFSTKRKHYSIYSKSLNKNCHSLQVWVLHASVG